MSENASEFIRLSNVPKIKWLERLVGGRLGLSTVYRWAQRGIRGRRLRTIALGGKGMATTEEWLRTFFAELGNAPDDACQTATERQRQINEAERELEAAGI